MLDALRDSVRVHLRSDVPVGALLSGGVDSAAICALAAEERPGMDVFTVGFERDGFSEIDRAHETATALGLRHHSVVVGVDEFVELPAAGSPGTSTTRSATRPPSRCGSSPARRAGTSASVLSGEGADELFGGYHNHRDAVDAGATRVPADYIGGEHVFVGDEVDTVVRGGTAARRTSSDRSTRAAAAEGLDVVAGDAAGRPPARGCRATSSSRRTA